MNKEKTVRDFAHYVPIGNAVDKIKKWADWGAQIVYMTSRKSQKEVSDIQNVLDQNSFPKEYWNIEKWVRNIKMLRKE